MPRARARAESQRETRCHQRRLKVRRTVCRQQRWARARATSHPSVREGPQQPARHSPSQAGGEPAAASVAPAHCTRRHSRLGPEIATAQPARQEMPCRMTGQVGATASCAASNQPPGPRRGARAGAGQRSSCAFPLRALALRGLLEFATTIASGWLELQWTHTVVADSDLHLAACSPPPTFATELHFGGGIRLASA